MEPEKTNALQQSYDHLADEYARRIFNELTGKPMDRALLDGFAERLRGRGLACDVGCGPGQIARYLHDRGVTVMGVDLSQEMIRQARKLNPNIEFQQGTMLALDFATDSLSGITAFYSLIHIPRDEVVHALLEFKRVLQPEGLLLLAFHLGEGDLHVEELWEKAVDMDFHFFTSPEMEGYLETAGFEIEEIIERDPYPPDIEHQSRRAYFVTRKPGRQP